MFLLSQELTYENSIRYIVNAIGVFHNVYMDIYILFGVLVLHPSVLIQ